MNEKRILLKILRKMEKAYPLDLLESHQYQKLYSKYVNKDFDPFERLVRNKLIEYNEQPIIQIEGEGFIGKKNDKHKLIVTKKYNKSKVPKSLKIPIISEKGFQYLHLRKQKRTNLLLIILTIISLFVVTIQLFLE